MLPASSLTRTCRVLLPVRVTSAREKAVLPIVLVAVAQLVPLLRTLPSAQEASLSQPPSPPGTLHLRWEADGLQRERLLSVTALRLCQEDNHGA